MSDPSIHTISPEAYAPLSPEEFSTLFSKVQEARNKAYAPYSEFRVGAVLLSTSESAADKYISGCNVENASYPAGICAERCALVKAVSEGITQFRAVAVITDMTDEACSPCGICRQMLREFAAPSKDGDGASDEENIRNGKDFMVIMFTANGEKIKIKSLKQLLPMSFGPENLGKSTVNN